MSGISYTDICPRCGRNNMQMYHDWKPWVTDSGICLDCGFVIYSDIRVDLEEAEELRPDYEHRPIPFTEKEKKRIKEFDSTYRWSEK
jgi:hypothetical protein